MLFSKQHINIGKHYDDGAIITRAGDTQVEQMYVILDGRVEILLDDGREEPFQLTVLEKGNVFGETSMFDGSPRLATARALGDVQVLSVDKKGFLKYLGEDPPTSLNILLKMAERIRTLIQEIVHLRKTLRKAGIDPDD